VCDLLNFELCDLNFVRQKMTLSIPVSVGELLDKITILQIKKKHSNNSYITKELNLLTDIAKFNDLYNELFLDELFEVNQKLWTIEDQLRELEKIQRFDETFIELARQVYITNNKRAAIKRSINEYYNSELFEIKLHK
jgi:hypothetical protein